MAIALTLQQYLAAQRVNYDLLPHAPTHSSMRTAETSHVPGDGIAKAVVVKEDGGYFLAVIPASHHVRLDALGRLLDREVALASEAEIDRLFRDCATGAVPPVGSAYGISTVVDDKIAGRPEVWFEAGDHATLVHMSGSDFARLTEGARHGEFSRHD
jgi:Ala-tRNA(Pro) deacylase